MLDGRARLGARCFARHRRGVAKALRSLGADVTEVDVVTRISNCLTASSSPLSRSTELSAKTARSSRSWNERGVAYTGEGVGGSRARLRQDSLEGRSSAKHGVTTPDWQVIRPGQRPTIPIPFVIKAPRQGSTVGVISLQERARDRCRDGGRARNTISEFLVEKFVPGRELTVGILGDGAADSRNHSEGRILRFHEQVSVPESERGWRRRARLSGEHSGGSDARDSGSGFAGASLAWPAGLFARRRHLAGRGRSRPSSKSTRFRE